MRAGRNISATKMAMGSTRVMGTCAVGGQAAGTAAAMAIEKGLLPRDIGNHMQELQQKLLKDDCYLPGIVNHDQNDLALKARVTADTGSNPEAVINGVTRNVDDDVYAWTSAALPGKLPLQWEQPVTISA